MFGEYLLSYSAEGSSISKCHIIDPNINIRDLQPRLPFWCISLRFDEPAHDYFLINDSFNKRMLVYIEVSIDMFMAFLMYLNISAIAFLVSILVITNNTEILTLFCGMLHFDIS